MDSLRLNPTSSNISKLITFSGFRYKYRLFNLEEVWVESQESTGGVPEGKLK